MNHPTSYYPSQDEENQNRLPIWTQGRRNLSHGRLARQQRSRLELQNFNCWFDCVFCNRPVEMWQDSRTKMTNFSEEMIKLTKTECTVSSQLDILIGRSGNCYAPSDSLILPNCHYLARLIWCLFLPLKRKFLSNLECTIHLFFCIDILCCRPTSS